MSVSVHAQESADDNIYPYKLPFLGKKAIETGHDIQYPVGIMLNTMNMKQHILIDQFQLGFQPVEGNAIALQDADFIKFGENSNIASTTTVRPDIWILPFLNVYGLFGFGHTSTDINISHLHFATHENIPILPIDMVANVKQNIAMNGFGTMLAGGAGPLFFTVDANWTWSKPEMLEKALRTQIIGVRVGHVFKNSRKPDKNFGLWIGAMSGKLGGAKSHGSIALQELIPASMVEKRNEIIAQYENWYDGLGKIQQGLVNNTPLPEMINKLQNWEAGGVIEYQFDKQLKAEWNGTIGCQYQFNKRWMLRSEGGVIGDRKSFMLSVNYRLPV